MERTGFFAQGAQKALGWFGGYGFCVWTSCGAQGETLKNTHLASALDLCTVVLEGVQALCSQARARGYHGSSLNQEASP